MHDRNYWDELEYSKLKLLLNKEKVDSIIDVAMGKKLLDEKFPISVELHLTDQCNLNCEWCTDRELRKNMATLPVESIEKIFQEFSMHKTGVTLEGGGEPTLHPDFREIVDMGYKYSLDMGLITNGIVDISDCIHKLKWIRVSLDSSNEKEYEKEKGANCFERVLTNIEKMSEVRNPQKTYIGVGYVLTKRNTDDIVTLVKRLDKMGVDYLYLRPVEEASDITLSLNELLEIRKCLAELTKDSRIKYMLNINDRIIDKNNALPCIAHSLTSIIHANGDVGLCEKRCGDNIILGNITHMLFSQIWSSSYREQVTQRLLNAECQKVCSACRITGFNMLFDSLDRLNTRHFI